MVQIDRDLNRRLMMLGIFELAPDMGTSANAEELKVKLAELGGDPSQVEHDELRQLADMGWLDTRDMTFGDDMGSITPRGRDVAAEIAQRRADVGARRVALRDLLLRWLYEATQVQDRNMPPLDDFLKTGQTYLGVAFDESDLDKAAGWLADKGMIGGIGAAQRRLIRVSIESKGIESKGIDVVERGRSVMDSDPSGGNTFNTTVHGPANVANQSARAVQVIDQSQTWTEATKQQLDLLEQASATFGTEIRDDVAETVAEVRAAVAEEDQPRAKAGLERLLPFLSSAYAGALGNLMSSGISALLGMLG